MSKKIFQLNVRVPDELRAEALAFCAERGITIAELVRRGVRAVIRATVRDDKPGAAPLPALKVEVSNVEQLAGDPLRPVNRSLRR